MKDVTDSWRSRVREEPGVDSEPIWAKHSQAQRHRLGNMKAFWKNIDTYLNVVSCFCREPANNLPSTHTLPALLCWVSHNNIHAPAVASSRSVHWAVYWLASSSFDGQTQKNQKRAAAVTAGMWTKQEEIRVDPGCHRYI